MGAIGLLLKRSLIPSGGQFLSFALWISVAGVILGIVELVVVLSVMSGFQQFLLKTYTDISSDLVVIPKLKKHITAPDIIDTEGVKAVSPFNLGQAMLTKEGAAGAVLEGIDEATTDGVTPWKRIWVDPPVTFPDPKQDWIWIGVQLAKKIGAEKGDVVNLFVPGKNKIYPLRVTAITKFGIYEHDLHYARVQLKYLDELMQGGLDEPMYKVAVLDDWKPEDVSWNISKKLGQSVRVRLASDVNKNFFEAVHHQKLSLFAVLQLVTCLAAMNVVNLLMMSAQHRRRDVAILRAMGLKRKSVFAYFVAQGTAVASVGIVGGVGFGLVACELIKIFQPTFLQESVYNVTRLPIKVNWGDVGVISVMAFLLCLLFSIVPAILASRKLPLEALRYE